MDTRRSFLKKASLLSGGAGLLNVLPPSIAKALAIDPAPGSTFLDAEHVVLLMQENRSFDHTYGTLQGVRGFNDPRAIRLPNKNLVWLQSGKNGETFAPFRFDIKDTKITWMGSIPHAWSDQVDARNNGKYDGWIESKRSGDKDYGPMPLTMGYYTRADIPFYYSLADAFTVCDQNFCSSLTGTTPNRLFYWTGTIREEQNENAIARVWNGDADYETMVSWKTFPERLEENGVSWKIYQNEIGVGVGFNEEEDVWLSNFGDNPIEYFTQYNVKLSPSYILNLPKSIAHVEEDIKKREQSLSALATGDKKADDIKGELEWLRKRLAALREDQKNYTIEKFEKLSPHQKSLHNKAFSINRNDPYYHQLTTLKYKDGNKDRQTSIPKGDILHQFREDVKKGQLPTVSWLVAPQNFSDHPSSPWYGAWYISEVMDILTKDPEVWKKTIFILTYDENDGYFDHVPPFTAPHPHKDGTGSVSSGINTGVEYVSSTAQQSVKDQARESPIGLGYRVPMVIASPWSRGGWVNSQVFDHTSSLLFLETFLSGKLKTKIEEPNISAWRRTICGDLTSVFRTYNGEKTVKPEFLEKDEFIESIHKAQFKNIPTNYRRLTSAEIEQVNIHPRSSPLLPVQEKGIRNSCGLPYNLVTDGHAYPESTQFKLQFAVLRAPAGIDTSTGAPFYVYSPGRYQNEPMKVWNYAVKDTHPLTENWNINDFENGQYQLLVYGPNGFFREFTGNKNDPQVQIFCIHGFTYDPHRLAATHYLQFNFLNNEKKTQTVEITDNSYKTGKRTQFLGPAGSKKAFAEMRINVSESYGWYDHSIIIKGWPSMKYRYAGRIETGLASKTDPAMGRVI
jgi:phospholipase C